MSARTSFAFSEELLHQIDDVAAERGQTRTAFVTEVLRLALKARRDSKITAQLDALFSDEKVNEEQRSGAQDLLSRSAWLEDESW